MMQTVNQGYSYEAHLQYCKCGSCEHDLKEACINGRCPCCDLEDMFSLLSKHEFKPTHTRKSFD